MDQFTHRITGHVNEDSDGRKYVKFSTYLSFLTLTCRIFLPDEGKDTTDVRVEFSLKRHDQNRDGTTRVRTP